MAEASDVFISFSHENAKWVSRSLVPFLNKHALRYWLDEKDIKGSLPIISEIAKGIRLSQKIVLVLSPNYLGSKWAKFERLMAQHVDLTNDEGTIVLLKIKPCNLPAELSIFKCLDFTKGNRWGDLLRALNITRMDWGEAPDVPFLFGRRKELATLKKWIVDDHCKVVAIIGMKGGGKTTLAVRLGKGGIGKTDLALKLARGIQHDFEYVIWRRLLNAPPAREVVADITRFISNQKETSLPYDFDEQINQLLHYLRNDRCLVILDNLESVLQGGIGSGEYKEEHLEYEALLQRLSEQEHKSCILFTSRERPRNVERLAGNKKPVRWLQLEGLKWSDGKKIFSKIGKSFVASNKGWKTLIECYNGNPLALELAAHHITEAFGGNVGEFLEKGKQVFGDLEELLDWHFKRLSDREKEIVCWLAINREPVLYSTLREDILSKEASDRLPSTLQSLQRRLPLETSSSAQEEIGPERSTASFSIQPVLVEYLTKWIVDQVCTEIVSKKIRLFNSITLLKASSKDYIRESQNRLVLKAIIDKLLDKFKTCRAFENRLKQVLQVLHHNYESLPGYAGGNLINILRQLGTDPDPCFKPSLRNYNFSNLAIWQAYLANMELQGVKFLCSDFSRVVFTENFSNIRAIAISPNGKYLAAAGGDKFIYIWEILDSSTVKRHGILSGHEGWILSLAFDPTNSNLLATGSDDSTVRMWEVETGRLLQTLSGHSAWVMSVAFSMDGRLIAGGSADGTVKIWDKILDVSNVKARKTLVGHKERVGTIAFHPHNSDILASGSEDGTIRLWKIGTGKCFDIVPVREGRVMSIAFSHDGRSLVSGGENSHVILWSPIIGKQRKHLRNYLGLTGRVRSVAFSPDGALVAAGSEDQTIRVWQTHNEECRRTFVGHSGIVRSIKYSPDGKSIVSGSDDRAIKFWNMSAGQCAKTLRGFVGSVRSIVFGQKSATLLTGSDDSILRLWETASGKCETRIYAHMLGIYSVAYSHKENLVASGGDDQIVKLWDGDLLKKARTLIDPILRGKSHAHRIWSLAFSPNGKFIASGSEDQTVKLWDCRKGRYIDTLRWHKNGVLSVVFSPDSEFLVSGSDDNTVVVWGIDKRKAIKTLHEHKGRVSAVAISPDGRLLASASRDTTVRLWDCEKWKHIGTLQGGHSRGVLSLAFCHDGKLLASGGNDNTIRVWDMTKNVRQLKPIILEGHKSGVNTVAFSPDGRMLASGSEDDTIRLWDRATWRCRSILRCDRPYERMNITGATGLTEGQRETLTALGAVDCDKTSES